MEKQIQKIEFRLRLIDRGEERIFNGDFPASGEFILSYLDRRRKILEKTYKKLLKLNKDNLVHFTL